MERIKKTLYKLSLVRFLALSRKNKGALGQLGWFDFNLEMLEVSGPSPRPWFVYGATDFIDHWVNNKATVLEFGGGASTRFWVERGNLTTTIENNFNWSELLKQKLSGKKNWNSYFLQEIKPAQLKELNLGVFDVVQVDHDGSDRSEIVGWAIDHLASDGILIWDNTDREEARLMISELRKSGFGMVSFFGLGPINAYASETSIFSRSFPSGVTNIVQRKFTRY